MTTPIKVRCKVSFERVGKGGRKTAEASTFPTPLAPMVKVPRVSRLMALAIKLDGLIRDGTIKDQADLARLGGITRARATQVLNLTLLCPTVQEEILQLACDEHGRAPVILADLQPIAQELDWRKQREMWAKRVGAARGRPSGGGSTRRN